MKVLVCITKVAEVEVDLDEARTYLDNMGEDTSDWLDQEVCEAFLSYKDDDPEFSTYVTIVTELEEVAGGVITVPPGQGYAMGEALLEIARQQLEEVAA